MKKINYFNLIILCFLILGGIIEITAQTMSAENSRVNNSKISSANINNMIKDDPNSCSYEWMIQSGGSSEDLETICAVNEDVCWYTTYATGKIYRTTNGGMSWIDAMPFPIFNSTIRALSAIDENTAFFGFTTSYPNGTAFLYKTSNGGQSWQQVHAMPGGYINGIQMIDSLTGFAQGPPINGVWTILKTTNGGNNWTNLPTAPAQIGNDVGVINGFQVKGQNMWFTSSPGSRLYRSTDLGVTWTYSSITPSGIYLFYFNDTDNGVLITNPISVRTTNGGQTFSPAGLQSYSYSIKGDGDQSYWALVYNTIHKSTDGGLNFIPDYTASHGLYGISLFEDGCIKGWAGGDNGLVLWKENLITGNNGNGILLPATYSISQNYPNPFNPTTKISYEIPTGKNVKVAIYNSAGKLVETLVNDFRNAGKYELTWNASGMPSGVYFYKLETGSFSETKKMLLVK